MPDFDNDTWHANEDKIVRKMTHPGSTSGWDVIQAIARSCDALDDIIFWEDAESLVASEEGMKDKLQELWKTKGPLKEVRNMIHTKQLAAKQKIRLAISALPEQTVQSAWNHPYVGEYHKLLLSNISKMIWKLHHTNTVAVVQSSGNGKSCQLREMERLVFTLPFHYGLDTDTKYFPWPQPDTKVRDYFTRPVNTEDELHTFYYSFFQSLFKKVLCQLQGWSSGSKGKYIDLVERWRQWLEGNRHEMYEDIVKQSEEFRAKHTRPTAAAAALRAVTNLCEYIEHNTSDKISAPTIIMYFDEAGTLTKSFSPGIIKTRYDVLCSVLSDFHRQSIFSIFLSTTFYIPELAPTWEFTRSSRIITNFRHLQAPITETPFDCSPRLPLDPDSLTFRHTYQIPFMAMFGRPLFWTMIEAAAPGDKPTITDRIIPFARTKITHPSKQGKVTDAGRAAVIDIRLMFDYEPRHQRARDREAALVASHMRIAYSAPHPREYIRSGYPSEPVLAEAAAQHMHAHPDDFSALRILEDNIQGGLIDKGERGELVARLLVTLALDRAINKRHKPDSESVIHSRGVPVIDFIRELFGDRAEAILKSVPDNTRSNVTFKDAFEGAWIRFTHFGKMGDATGATLAAARAAFIRCMAIVCPSGQMMVNIILPIIFCPQGAESHITETNMSALLIHVERRAPKGPRARYVIDESTIGFFPNGTANQRPYVTLVMELGVPPKIPPPSAVTPPKPEILARGRLHHATDAHSRYSIFAYGCSDAVYGVISRHERARYQHLLGSPDFLDEHPRQTHRTLDAVKRLKPFFSHGPSSYHWIKDAQLGGAAHARQYRANSQSPSTVDGLESRLFGDTNAEDSDVDVGYTDEDFAEDSIEVGRSVDLDAELQKLDGVGEAEASLGENDFFGPTATLMRKRGISDSDAAQEGANKRSA